ncbi:MAG TPA: BrnT family toxin [Longimicrobium sp.]
MHTFGEAEFEWDDGKAAVNLAKHGVDIADALFVFDDPRAITLGDDHPGEERYVTFGMDALGRLVGVAYTWRGDAVRIISARKATRTEARLYAAGEP